MGENKVHRLPVMSRDKRLVGIVSFGNVALYGDSEQADTAATAVSELGGSQTQTG
jgi:CBS domain-containing protein